MILYREVDASIEGVGSAPGAISKKIFSLRREEGDSV
jgi:hypothetical protein